MFTLTYCSIFLFKKKIIIIKISIAYHGGEAIFGFEDRTSKDARDKKTKQKIKQLKKNKQWFIIIYMMFG